MVEQLEQKMLEINHIIESDRHKTQSEKEQLKLEVIRAVLNEDEAGLMKVRDEIQAIE